MARRAKHLLIQARIRSRDLRCSLVSLHGRINPRQSRRRSDPSSEVDRLQWWVIFTVRLGVQLLDRVLVLGLFGDLVGSAIGQGKSNRNVPLKNAPPVSTSGSSKSPYSMGNLTDSLPKSGNSMKSGGGGGSGYSSNSGGFSGGYASSGGLNPGVNANSVIKGPNLGGPSMKNMSGSNLSGSGLPLNNDPFGSLVGFGSKSSASINSGSKTGKVNKNAQSDAFGNLQSSFQSGAKPNSSGLQGSLYIGSLLVGLAYGSQWSLMPTITSEIFGILHMGTIFYTISIASPVGSYFFSVKVIGYLYDKVASEVDHSCYGNHCFRTSFIIMATMALFGSLVAFVLFLRSKKFYATLVANKILK